MKKNSFIILILILLSACKTLKKDTKINNEVSSIVNIDLINIVDDKVKVEMVPLKFRTKKATFYIPKTIPGTYSTDNYGKYIENFIAYDLDGNKLNVNHPDDNSWIIANAEKISKISYEVNDTYDIESNHSIFSPAGSNILKERNFLLNLHCFVGYFKEHSELPYLLNINHPSNLIGNTALTDLNTDDSKDTFSAKRYFEITDNPIMYAPENNAKFKIGNMEILLSVYSPNNIIKAKDLKKQMEEIMQAQNIFLGNINTTKKYCILLYMSSGKNDATGYGALEHHNSTTVVFPEIMPKQALTKSIKDVVSHEFFHILTPLNLHSVEVHNFDYNKPKMSKHLWMYEGVTEYFANLFQVNQGLIDQNEFYKRIVNKINSAKNYNDSMSFTKMSENILIEPYKKNYINVYEKGALIGMCIDLIIREKSNGEKGILDLMKKLSTKYGVDKPFKDDKLFDDIAKITYPEVTEFINKHVIGSTPINYSLFLKKIGLAIKTKNIQTGYLFKDMQTSYIDVDKNTKEIIFLKETNSFLTSIGIKENDRLVSIDNKKYNLDNIQDLVTKSFQWSKDDRVNIIVKRNSKEIELNGNITIPMAKNTTLEPLDLPLNDKKLLLRRQWMKN